MEPIYQPTTVTFDRNAVVDVDDDDEADGEATKQVASTTTPRRQVVVAAVQKYVKSLDPKKAFDYSNHRWDENDVIVVILCICSIVFFYKGLTYVRSAEAEWLHDNQFLRVLRVVLIISCGGIVFLSVFMQGFHIYSLRRRKLLLPKCWRSRKQSNEVMRGGVAVNSAMNPSTDLLVSACNDVQPCSTAAPADHRHHLLMLRNQNNDNA